MPRMHAAPSPRQYRSSEVTGFSPDISSDPRRVQARKRVREIQVEFTPTACTIETAEGTVKAQPGDAIITGTMGERWRVARDHFADKYQALPPTVAGQPGRYLSLPNQILAVLMSEAFEVLLVDGSRLIGHPDDWLVDYGDGSLGVVSRGIFPATYEIID